LSGNYRLRRKSTTESSAPPSSRISKTKSVKRRRQSGLDTAREDKPDNNNRESLTKKPPVTLEITPVLGNTKSSASSTSSVESPRSPDKPVAKAVEENVDDDEDEGNDVVMVELDEEFVVEKVESKSDCCTDTSPSQEEASAVEVNGEESSAPVHRCVLCRREFKHYVNLQVHLTGHLGVKVNIFMCKICKRKFRNQNELELHTKSHQFAKMLGRKVSGNRSGVKAKVISTAGSTEKKIIRKYLKGQDKSSVNNVNGQLKQKHDQVQERPKKKAVTPAAKKTESLTCGLCDKSFGVKSLYLRHVKKAHPELSLKLETHSQLKAVPKINVKNCSLPRSMSSPSMSPVKVPSTTNIIKGKPSPAPHTPKRQISTPVSTKKKERTKTDSVSSVPDLPDYYNTLECPDCSRVFIAKSIFERHLQSAKHGMYAQCYSNSDSDSFAPQTPPAPHWTETPFQADAGSPHKIECHLCSQTFVRVKDLAKHREKMCQAYHSGKANPV